MKVTRLKKVKSCSLMSMLQVGVAGKASIVGYPCVEVLRENNLSGSVWGWVGYCFTLLPMLPYTWNFSQHVYFTVKHGTRIFTVEISRMKVIQTFSRLATWLYTKNLYYYFKLDRRSSLPSSMSQLRQL